MVTTLKNKIGKRYEVVREVDGKKDGVRYVMLVTSLPPNLVTRNEEVPSQVTPFVILLEKVITRVRKQKTVLYRVNYMDNHYEEDVYVFEWQLVRELNKSK